MFERVALIGIGLIGSSLARIIKRDGLAGHVVACARTQATLDTVMQLGIADSVTTSAADAADGADLVVICTPVGTYDAIGKELAVDFVAKLRDERRFDSVEHLTRQLKEDARKAKTLLQARFASKGRQKRA